MEGIGGFFVVALIVTINLLRAANKTQKKRQEEKLRERAEAFAAAARTEPRAAAQRRAAARDDGQWRAAREKQADAAQVHSIHMDSCENRLESLRVLYEAGILDREEYAERTARVRAQHAHGLGR